MFRVAEYFAIETFLVYFFACKAFRTQGLFSYHWSFFIFNFTQARPLFAKFFSLVLTGFLLILRWNFSFFFVTLEFLSIMIALFLIFATIKGSLFLSYHNSLIKSLKYFENALSASFWLLINIPLIFGGRFNTLPLILQSSNPSQWFWIIMRLSCCSVWSNCLVIIQKNLAFA